MQINQISIKTKATNAIDFIKAIFYVLGIFFCLIIMFFTLEKYTYNEFGKFMDEMPMAGKYLTTIVLNIAIFLFSYKLFFSKRRNFIVYILPFISSIISIIMYWQGFLRITDPTDSQSILLYRTALRNDIFQFFIVLTAEALLIVLALIILNKKSIKNQNY